MSVVHRLKESQDEVQKLRRELGDAHRRNDMLDKQLKASVTEKLSAQQKVAPLSVVSSKALGDL